MESVIKTLIEDRQKRKQELTTQQAAEETRCNEERETRERREEEWRAERNEVQESRERQEEEWRAEQREMQEHMQTIMEMMRTSGKTSKAKPSAGISVKLVPLAENDDVEAYLVTFERIMAAHKVEKSRWSQYPGTTIIR